MTQIVGHYNILERVGAGGMGEVFRARDTKLGRTVALKMLPDAVASDPERRERFLREARAAAVLSHPNIATLFEIGEDAGRLYLVFEFIPGETLRATLAGGPLKTRRAIEFGVQLADALADAHAAGIVHRDIKPDNIIITPKDKAKILDFGLASWTVGGALRVEAATSTRLSTEPGIAMGTIAYMSPEQTLGERVDARTDIFSLGLVILEMLTGRNPFVGTTAGATSINIVQAAAPAPSTVNRDVPPELDPILAKALSKDLASRYQSAASLAAELRSVATVLDIRTGETEPAPRLPAPARKSRWKPLAALLALVALGAAGWTWGRDPARMVWRRYVAAPPEPVIAVMPLEEVGDERQYFAGGLTDDLITRLGQTRGLKVLGRSSTRQFRGQDPTVVARQLGAAAVLTGTVYRSGDELKVNVALLDATDGIQIWSDQFLRPLTNVFAVQAEIADEVARALRVTLTPGSSRARTASRRVDPRAYDLYVQGREAAARRRVDEAIALFERAIAADGSLAEAHAGLAEALYLLVINTGDPNYATARDRIATAAREAATIDPDLPQAQLALGLASRSFEEVLTHLRRAVEADPSYAEALHQIGDQLLPYDPAGAIQFYRRCLEMDPQSDVTDYDLGIAQLSLGQRNEAEQRAQARISTNSSPIFGPSLLFMVRMDQARYPEADRIATDLIARLDRLGPAPLLPFALFARMQALAAAGRFEEALAIAQRGGSLRGWPAAGHGLVSVLLIDSGAREEGAVQAESLIAAAEAPDASPISLRVAITAAAGLRDASRAAGLIRRAIANEEMFRIWSITMSGSPGQFPLLRTWYPWKDIAESPEIRAVLVDVQRENGRLKAIAAKVLAGLLDR
jgi:TolB-like protein